MWLVELDPYGDPQPLAPCAFSQFFYLPFTTAELALAIRGVEEKSLKISEVIENEARDLAGKGPTFFMPRRLRYSFSGRRRQNLRRIAPKAYHSARDLLKIPEENRIPAIVMGDRLGDPAQDREVPLLS